MATRKTTTHGAQRKRIGPDEKIPLDLNNQERELILEHTFADDQLTRPLQLVPSPGRSRASYHFTLNDLDDLAGFVAAEANHASDKKLQKQLERLYDRIDEILNSYTNQDD